MKLFKSREEKEMERKLAIKRTLNELTKADRSMQKKKDEMLKLAQDAKEKGIEREYITAKNGLKSMMKFQQNVQAVKLRIQIAESMRDVSSVNMKALNTMGAIGKEIGTLMNSANFAKNQAAFEMGMMKMDEMLSQMEGLMEDTDMSLNETSDETLDSEIEQLIAATGAAQATKEDDEINQMLKNLEQKKSALKE